MTIDLIWTPKGISGESMNLTILVQIFLVLATLETRGFANTQSITEIHQFPAPKIVRKQVRFWEKIFKQYPSTTVVIHDSHDLDRIIDIIDYKEFAKRDNQSRPVPRRERDRVTKKYVKRYLKALKRFHRLGRAATNYAAIEKRVYNVYRRSPVALANLYKGRVRIRGQAGLADEFHLGAARAKGYLPVMEDIFRKNGLPTLLTRLAFVESMFNLNARSKVGASGVWQFMPSTARRFVFVNRLVDERNDPIKATRAASQLLGHNYRAIKSWPLAITAYNHGLMGMRRAVQRLGTKDIGQIIKYYRHRNYGFASKNFYAEFLAAAQTYESMGRRKNIKASIVIPNTKSIFLSKPMSLKELFVRTPLTERIIKPLNPCIKQRAYAEHRHKLLPRYYEIKVPDHMFRSVEIALNASKNSRYARR
jgi:membrane-bound lytic murein transglycosylase D